MKETFDLKYGLAAALLLSAAASTQIWAQGLPAATTPPAARRAGGGFIPGQDRPVGDPVQIERGGKIYGISCRSCHGADLRGGDMGGPNLLRSMAALSDRNGEVIVPIIHGSLQSSGMPAIKMSDEDAKATAAYVRSVLSTIGSQGKPPETGKEPPSILVGDAKAGQAFFDSKCSSCHSATGDLKGIATRIPDPKMLQNTWVAGGRAGRGAPARTTPPRPVTAVVTLPTGPVEGRLVRIDDFLVTLELADGTTRSFRRDGDVPKVEVKEPLKAHRDLYPVYTDKNMHDVTSYLVTLK